MADKITSFEDYKKKELHKEVAEEIAAEISPEKGPSADTGRVSQATMDIKIEDPYNFFNEEEREEYFRQRQKDLMKEKQREEAPRQSRDDEPPIRQHHKAEEEDVRREERRPEPEEYDDYDEEYEDEYDDEYDEEEGGITMELVVRIASVLSGIVILALIAMFAKVKIYDRYFAPDPDNAVTEEVVKALPEGYIEKNDTVVVSGASSLNLRTVPDSSDDATVVDAAAEGTELKRIAVSSDGSWALVEYNGQNLYAYMKYLVEK
ncbi:MAG: hypothetical protein K6G10_00820 [Butyrivibrio sp.]|nr:hypothetical protein [Butyrivibrio sp.]